MNRLSTIIIIFLASLLIGAFLVRPKYQELKIKKDELFQKEAELKSLKEYAVELRSLSEELANYSDEMAKIDLALPQRFSVPSFLNYIQKTTSENGLILKNYSVSGEPVKGNAEGTQEGIKEYGVGLNLSGSYASFKNFLDALENNSRLIEVENISFSYPEKEKPIDFNIDLKVHSY